jgi:hypothetical protein
MFFSTQNDVFNCLPNCWQCWVEFTT